MRWLKIGFRARGAPVIGLAALLAGLPGSAAGQETEIALDSLESGGIEQLLGEEENQLKISGFGVGSFDYRSGTQQNTLSAGKLAVSVYKRMGDEFSFFGQLTTLFESTPSGLVGGDGGGGHAPVPAVDGSATVDGSASLDVGTSSADTGGGEGPATSTEIDNLIISYTPAAVDGLSFWLGRFDAPLGFERDDEPLNFQPTNSFNFEFARPVKFTGALASYSIVPQVDVSAWVTNGWDVSQDNNNGKTVGGRVSLLPGEYAAVSFTGLYGPEKDNNTKDKRFLFTTDFTTQPREFLILGGEFNYGSEQKSAPDGTTANWVGGVLTAFLRFTRTFGTTLRYDVFNDIDGSRTGSPRTLQSFTVAPMLFFHRAQSGIFSTIPQTGFSLPEFQLRAGLRFNHSNDAFFVGDAGAQNDETRLVVEGVFVY